MVSMLFSNRNSRLGFQFGRQSALRATSDTLEQLQAQNAELKRQLDAERRRSAALFFNQEQQQREIVQLLRENAQLSLDIARRDRQAAFARFEDPTATRH